MKWSAKLLSLIFAMSFLARPAQAEPMHEFVMSCTYGVLAGSMVGAATLAFASEPGQNLNAIARGASLGLYAGILLGLYVVYAVPTDDEKAVEEQSGEVKYNFRPPAFMLSPTFSPQNKMDGAVAKLRVLEFN